MRNNTWPLAMSGSNYLKSFIKISHILSIKHTSDITLYLILEGGTICGADADYDYLC
jgi:hypothetical protein